MRLLAQGLEGVCGQSSLTTAAAIGEVAIAKTLLAKGADVNATGANEATALHVAVEGGHTAVVKLLIEKGASVAHRASEVVSSQSPLRRCRFENVSNRFLRLQAARVGTA